MTQGPTLRFILMHKNDPNTEAGKPPPLELVHEARRKNELGKRLAGFGSRALWRIIKGKDAAVAARAAAYLGS